MHILYLDESGVHAEANTFVLGGLAVFEREIYWMTEDVEAIQERYFPGLADPVEFHVAPLRAPDEKIPAPFNTLTKEQRRSLINDVYQVIRRHKAVVFGIAIEKKRIKEDPYERAFEELVSRFDLFLARKNALANAQGQEEHRGLIVVAESSYRQQLEILGRDFRGGATRWREVHNLADVPFFVPAANNRLLQLADFIANAIYGRYNSGYSRDFDVIATKFDKEGGRLHGMTHLCTDAECPCIACLSKQQARAIAVATPTD
ncbi:MAG: DUF3800 domain-containing protein [Candidatus Korobacteraceae bacterium]